jgi:hypothetical protein
MGRRKGRQSTLQADSGDEENGNFKLDKSASSMRGMSSYEDARVGSEDECKTCMFSTFEF